MDRTPIEQKMVMLAQRLYIDEEMDRLSTHLAEVDRVLTRKEPVGRRLDPDGPGLLDVPPERPEHGLGLALQVDERPLERHRALIRPDRLVYLRGRVDRRREEPSLRVSETCSCSSMKRRASRVSMRACSVLCSM